MFFKMRQILSQNAPAILLQTVTVLNPRIIIKWVDFIKKGHSYNKMGPLIQNASVKQEIKQKSYRAAKSNLIK